jgi:hypothetical protein
MRNGPVVVTPAATAAPTSKTTTLFSAGAPAGPQQKLVLPPIAPQPPAPANNGPHPAVATPPPATFTPHANAQNRTPPIPVAQQANISIADLKATLSTVAMKAECGVKPDGVKENGTKGLDLDMVNGDKVHLEEKNGNVDYGISRTTPGSETDTIGNICKIAVRAAMDKPGTVFKVDSGNADTDKITIAALAEQIQAKFQNGGPNTPKITDKEGKEIKLDDVRSNARPANPK